MLINLNYGGKLQMNYNFAILKNETKDDHLGWIIACENSKYNIKYKVIDITKNDWLENVLSEDFDCILTRATGTISYFKQLYDERLYVINNILKKKIYPTYEEILIYENKRMLSYWLDANNIPHAKTWIFYHKEEAMQFAKYCAFPVVAKTAIGASGSGVKIFDNKLKLISYINKAFSDKGITRKWTPNLRKGKIKERILKRIKDIPGFLRYLEDRHKSATIDPQKWFVIFQEYIDAIAEWRTVRIGDSFFAHKKQRKGKTFSGGGGIDWDGPSDKLLDFMKMVTDKRKFLSQAIDIFEDNNGNFYVNELQCFFGFIHPHHQMIINGKPGRYIYIRGKWIFEEGTFNTNNSYNLRLEHIIQLLENDQL